jgi:hypothetical protein
MYNCVLPKKKMYCIIKCERLINRRDKMNCSYMDRLYKLHVFIVITSLVSFILISAKIIINDAGQKKIIMQAIVIVGLIT